MNVVMIALSLSIFNGDFAICTAKTNQIYPRAIYNNKQYYVFWSDYRHGSDYAVYGTRVDAVGKVFDPDGKLLYKNKAAYQPAIASDGKNFFAVFRDGC